MSRDASPRGPTIVTAVGWVAEAEDCLASDSWGVFASPVAGESSHIASFPAAWVEHRMELLTMLR